MTFALGFIAGCVTVLMAILIPAIRAREDTVETPEDWGAR
jgi:hypothetical protein